MSNSESSTDKDQIEEPEAAESGESSGARPLAEADAADVIALHRSSGAGVLAARNALIEAHGDMTEAMRRLVPAAESSPVAARPEKARTRRDKPVDELQGRLQGGETLRGVEIERLALRGDYRRRVRILDSRIDRLVIDGALLVEGASFARSTIGVLRIVNSRSPGGLNLGRCQLGSATVEGSEFGRLELTELQAAGQVRFGHTSVDGPLLAWGAEFAEWLELEDCQLGAMVDMRSMRIRGGLSLENCRVVGDFRLRGTSVALKMDTQGTRFEGLLDLSRAKLHDFAYLEDADFGPDARVRVHNLVTERLCVAPSQLEDRLESESRHDYRRASEEYGLLRRNYERLHRYDDEDWALLRFKVSQRRARHRSWAKPWTRVSQFLDWLVLEEGCGYGTDPVRTVRSAFLIMLAFGLLYAIASSSFSGTMTPVPNEPADSLVNRAVSGLLTSVSVFTTGFDADLFRSVTGPVLGALVVEAVAGVFIWGLFIVAFARKVIR